MTNLTAIYTEDLASRGIATNPVGRGNVSEGFSKACCEKIPGAMVDLAKSGLLKDFAIVTRGNVDETVPMMLTGAEIVEQADTIGEELAARITGEKAKIEEADHFKVQYEKRSSAVDKTASYDYDKLVSLYIAPTITFLKETDGAISFYKEESKRLSEDGKGVEIPLKENGDQDLSYLAKWIIATKLLPSLTGVLEQVKEGKMVDTEAFDALNTQSNGVVNKAGEEYTVIITNLAVLADQIAKQSKEALEDSDGKSR